MFLGHTNNSKRANNKNLHHTSIVVAWFLQLATGTSVNFSQFPRDASIVNKSRNEYLIDPFVVITPKAEGPAEIEMLKRTKKKNLTAVKWAHAVNSQEQLTDALLNSSIDMIEADIVMGKHYNTGPDMPIMAHPPAKSSDLPLYSFLEQINEYNIENVKKMKGIKLDFKSIEAFESSLDILADTIPEMTYPIWLNADIVRGPVNQTTIVPVDPDRFLYGCYEFENAVLSIGWTTKWSSEYHSSNDYYTPDDIQAMLEAIRRNYITEKGQRITFPVRAGIAANSINELHHLVNSLEDSNPCTLTIWSAQNDYVDVERLEHLIRSFGLDRVYLDVPEELYSQLSLSRKDDNAGGGVGTTKKSLLNFSLMSAGIFVLCLFYKRLRS